LVYACHLLEHIPAKETSKVLWEWKRILKPGGILRLSVPDFDKLIEVYERCSRDIQSIFSPLMGAYDGYKTHCAIFNYKYLSQILIDIGFREVREWKSDKVDHHDFEDWASKSIKCNGNLFHISLNLEAIK
jgi:predicted SAM-dependent methyltransferase